MVHALLLAVALMAPHARALLVPRAQLQFELVAKTPALTARKFSLGALLPRVMPRVSWLRTVDGGRAGLLGVSGEF